jgi:hypothetical protein
MTSPPLLPPADPHDGFFLWGAPNAGKSGFIGGLYGLSRAADGERWTAHPKDCDDPHTQEIVLRAYEELRHRKNTKTGVRDVPYRPLKLTLRKMRGAREVGALRVALVDPAGEFSTDPTYRASSAGRALYREVATSHGVLWLFEATPDGAPATLDRLLILEQLIALLEAGGATQLTVPVALCLSKIDCLSEERRQAVLADPTRALLDHLGATSLTWFEAVCPTLRCFAVSSAGTVADKVRPLGVNEVLDWLEAERARLVRDAKVAATVAGVRAKVSDLVRRWSGPALRATVVLALATGAAYGGTKLLPAASPAGTTTATGDATRVRRPTPDSARSAAGDVVRRPTGRGSDRRAPDRRNVPGRFDAQLESEGLLSAWRAALRRQADGDEAGPLLADVRDRATRLIDHAPPGSETVVPARLVRARACLLADIDCDPAMIREDLTWVLAQGDGGERRTAARLLAALDEQDVRDNH